MACKHLHRRRRLWSAAVQYCDVLIDSYGLPLDSAVRNKDQIWSLCGRADKYCRRCELYRRY